MVSTGLGGRRHLRKSLVFIGPEDRSPWEDAQHHHLHISADTSVTVSTHFAFLDQILGFCKQEGRRKYTVSAPFLDSLSYTHVRGFALQDLPGQGHAQAWPTFQAETETEPASSAWFGLPWPGGARSEMEGARGRSTNMANSSGRRLGSCMAGLRGGSRGDAGVLHGIEPGRGRRRGRYV